MPELSFRGFPEECDQSFRKENNKRRLKGEVQQKQDLSDKNQCQRAGQE